MQQQLKINSAQYELLNVLSCINNEEDLADLKTVIVQFLNSRLQREIDRLWDNGTLSEEKVTAWGEDRLAYDHALKRYRDTLNAMNGAEQKGREEGREEAKCENARRMKADNMPVELIAKYTGLTIEEIEQL